MCVRKKYSCGNREGSWRWRGAENFGGDRTDHGIESRDAELRLSGRWDKGELAAEGNWGWVSATTDTGLEAPTAELGAEGGPYLLLPGTQSRHRDEAQIEKTGKKETETKRDMMAFGSIHETR